jgi:hypothetical protein
MPTGKRKGSASAVIPLINFDEVAAEKESFRLSWTVLANLRDYVAYVGDVTGRETTPDEVIDKGMQRLFDADKGFRQWLQKKNTDGRNKPKSAKAERNEKIEKPFLDSKAGTAAEPVTKLPQ